MLIAGWYMEDHNMLFSGYLPFLKIDQLCPNFLTTFFLLPTQNIKSRWHCIKGNIQNRCWKMAHTSFNMQHLRLFEDRHEDQEAADDEEDDGKNDVHFDRPLEIWLFPSGSWQFFFLRKLPCCCFSSLFLIWNTADKCKCIKMNKAIDLVFADVIFVSCE